MRRESDKENLLRHLARPISDTRLASGMTLASSMTHGKSTCSNAKSIQIAETERRLTIRRQGHYMRAILESDVIAICAKSLHVALGRKAG
jgi:hypothetical protein